MWIANYDRLPTRSRLAAWGLQVSPTCPLCSTYDETRDHLLIQCDFGKDVWREILIRCQPPAAMFKNQEELLSWIRSSPSKRLTLLRKLAVHTFVFHLWKQRNSFIHNQISLSAATVFYAIDKEMRNIISARRKRKQFRSLMTMWLRQIVFLLSTVVFSLFHIVFFLPRWLQTLDTTL